LGSCNTVEEFWSFYAHIKRPQDLPNDTNIHLFRGTVSPMWEHFPNGGIWVVRLKKNSPLLARMWEELLIATIGEVFEEPDVVGVVLRIRKKEDSLVLWNKDQSLRYRIGEKLKQVLVLPANCPGMEYQTNRHNILMEQRSQGANKLNAEAKQEGETKKDVNSRERKKKKKVTTEEKMGEKRVHGVWVGGNTPGVYLKIF